MKLAEVFHEIAVTDIIQKLRKVEAIGRVPITPYKKAKQLKSNVNMMVIVFLDVRRMVLRVFAPLARLLTSTSIFKFF